MGNDSSKQILSPAQLEYSQLLKLQANQREALLKNYKNQLDRLKQKQLIDKSKATNLITERPFQGPNAHTFMVLSMGFGIISAISHEKNIPMIAMPPMEAKIHFIGNNKMKGEKKLIW